MQESVPAGHLATLMSVLAHARKQAGRLCGRVDVIQSPGCATEHTCRVCHMASIYRVHGHTHDSYLESLAGGGYLLLLFTLLSIRPV